nr:hypothetical protein [Tanacetum cinerariifolium]
MISGHAREGYYDVAIDYFQRMTSSGVKPTRSTLGSVLSANASTFDLECGSQVHAQAVKQGLSSNVYVGSSLINLYAKCQEMDSARTVFDALDEKNIVLWNTMLGGYAQNRNAGNALVDMYAKSGCLEDARKQFNMIKNRDNVSWNAMIVGFVQEEEEELAFSMFQRMRSVGITPDEVCFASILSACANIRSLTKGKQPITQIQYGN